jgi:hypothetical protein
MNRVAVSFGKGGAYVAGVLSSQMGRLEPRD